MNSWHSSADRRDRQRYLSLRSVLVTPLLDEHKWSKLPNVACDGLLLDLEDTVPPNRREEALERALQVLDEADRLPHALLMPRPNPVASPTGPDEIAAFSRAGARILCCPKIDGPDAVHQTVDCARSNGADPDIFAVIETAAGLRAVEEIARIPEVCGPSFGPGDLAVDAGMLPTDDDGTVLHDLLLYARSRIVVAAAAERIARLDNTFTHDLNDRDAVRREIAYAKRYGFTGVSTFYAPFVDMINATFAPTADEIAAARECVDRYERALAAGATGYQHDGRAFVVHDFEHARDVLRRAGASESERPVR